MKYIFTLFTILCNCLGIPIKTNIPNFPAGPNDHIVEHYMQKTLKNLLHVLGEKVGKTVKPLIPPEAVPYHVTPRPSYALGSREECKEIVRLNLNSCLKETTKPNDLKNATDWWTPGNDTVLMKRLQERYGSDAFSDIPDGLKYCTKWAKGASGKCKSARRSSIVKSLAGLEKYKNQDILKLYDINPNLLYKSKQNRPHWDRTEQFDTDDSDLDEYEAMRVLCVYITMKTLDGCIKGVDSEDLEQLQSNWKTSNINLMLRLLVSTEINEFEGLPMGLKNCMVQAKHDFNQCTLMKRSH